MCLAIAKPAGETVPREYLYEGFAANADGAGFAFADSGRLVVRKGFRSFERFLEAYDQVDERDASLIHFRLASHGRISKENCHPWSIGDGLCVIHNGILPWKSSKRTSDTGFFVRELLYPNRHRINEPKFKEVIEKFIGGGNKLAFLDAEGDFTIYNEDAGHWNDGIWYSNDSYRNNFSELGGYDDGIEQDAFLCESEYWTSADDSNPRYVAF